MDISRAVAAGVDFMLAVVVVASVVAVVIGCSCKKNQFFCPCDAYNVTHTIWRYAWLCLDVLVSK
jgi:hypothetical protein